MADLSRSQLMKIFTEEADGLSCLLPSINLYQLSRSKRDGNSDIKKLGLKGTYAESELVKA